MKTFGEALHAYQAEDAASVAGALFEESFHGAFPIPSPYRILDTDGRAEDWRQFVAVYTWHDGKEECVGFLNYIRFRNVYLGGGMCVKPDFYRRLSREHFAECKRRGGVAQILLDTAAATIDDAIALFGYCGDARAMKVDLRAGYLPTAHHHVIVKPLGKPDPAELQRAIDEVARVGPF